MLPDLYKDRESMLEEVAELQKRVAMLRMYGPRSREDLELYYFIITGQIRVPRGPIWAWEQWYDDQRTAAGFQSGIFSARRLIGAYAPARDPNHRFDVASPDNQIAWPNLDALYAGPGGAAPGRGFAVAGIGPAIGRPVLRA